MFARATPPCVAFLHRLFFFIGRIFFFFFQSSGTQPSERRRTVSNFRNFYTMVKIAAAAAALSLLSLAGSASTAEAKCGFQNCTKKPLYQCSLSQCSASDFPSSGSVDLSSKYLTGTIPVPLFASGVASGFVFDNNLLTGPIPEGLPALIVQSSGLTSVSFDANQLSGTLPPTLGSLSASALLAVGFRNNLLTGTLPSSLGSANSDRNVALSLSGNHFSGALPSSMCPPSSAAGVAVPVVSNGTPQDKTAFSCPLPASCANSSISLHSAAVDSQEAQNSSSSYDSTFRYRYPLQPLRDCHNKALADCDLAPCAAVGLTYLNLQGAGLYGTIPPTLVSLTATSTIDLRVNSLTGTLPDSWFSPAPLALGELYLVDNQLTGTLPAGACTSPTLTALNLDSVACPLAPECVQKFPNLQRSLSTVSDCNNIPIDQCELYLCAGSLTTLNLAFQHLRGSIPASLSSLASSLTGGLNLGSNQLTGQLPPAIGSFVHATAIDLSFNDFSGTLPTALSSLDAGAAHVNLGGNAGAFSGPFPESLCSLENAGGLSISGVGFECPLPEACSDALLKAGAKCSTGMPYAWELPVAIGVPAAVVVGLGIFAAVRFTRKRQEKSEYGMSDPMLSSSASTRQF